MDVTFMVKCNGARDLLCERLGLDGEIQLQQVGEEGHTARQDEEYSLNEFLHTVWLGLGNAVDGCYKPDRGQEREGKRLVTREGRSSVGVCEERRGYKRRD